MATRLHSYQKKVYQVMQEISDELGIPIEVVDRMIHSCFTGIKLVMSNAEIGKPETFKSIILTDVVTIRPRKKYIKDYWRSRWSFMHQKNYRKKKPYHIILAEREQFIEDRKRQDNT